MPCPKWRTGVWGEVSKHVKKLSAHETNIITIVIVTCCSVVALNEKHN